MPPQRVFGSIETIFSLKHEKEKNKISDFSMNATFRFFSKFFSIDNRIDPPECPPECPINTKNNKNINLIIKVAVKILVSVDNFVRILYILDFFLAKFC